MKFIPSPFKTDANWQTTVCDGSLNGYFGYIMTILTKNLADTSVIGWIPFGYKQKPTDNCDNVKRTLPGKRLFVVNKTPLNKYTHYFSPIVNVEPLREDCVVMRGNTIITALEILALNYPYCYVLRYPTENHIRKSVSTTLSKHIMASVFRVCDVYPPDIINTDGVAVKVHDGIFEYVDVVFSHNENMFNTDGFKFVSEFDFADAIGRVEYAVKLLEKKHQEKIIKILPLKIVRRKRQSRVSYSIDEIMYTSMIDATVAP